MRLSLIASTTSYTNDLKVYELKISENIHGNIIEEYSELLSGNSLDSGCMASNIAVTGNVIPENVNAITA